MSMSKKILFFTAHYAPEPNFITEDLSVALANKGHRVTVITTYPNYPGGKFYDNRFHLYPTREVRNGVNVIRVPHFPDHSRSSVVRFLSYISFAICALIVGIIIAPMNFPDKIIIYQTPFFSAIAGLPYRIFRVPLIYICVDLWPESLLATGVTKSGPLINVLFWYSKLINKFAHSLIVSTRGMQKRYLRDGFNESRVHFLPVWVDGIPQKLPQALEIRKHSKRVIYAGNLGLAQGLDVFIEAFKQPEVIDSGLELYFVGIGNDLERLSNLARGCQNIHFMGRVSPDQAFDMMHNSLAVTAHLVASPQFEMTLPSKLASCLASGTPFLCGINGETNEMFESFPSVFQFKSGDVAALVTHLIDLSLMGSEQIKQIGLDNQDVYRKCFEKDKIIQQYLEII